MRTEMPGRVRKKKGEEGSSTGRRVASTEGMMSFLIPCGGPMTTLPHPCLEMQASEQSQPSVPPWFAETVLLVEYLRTHGLFDALTNQVHLVRGRFGQYEVLDFLALLFGYAISGERTLQAYFDRLKPFAGPFMALFERNRLPHRTTLGRFLAAVAVSCLAAVRTLFVSSSFTWGWTQETIGGGWDRTGRRL